MNYFENPVIPTPEEFVKKFNKFRLNNPDKWVVYDGKVGKYTLQVKRYNTWIQIYRVSKVNQASLNNSSSMGITIKEFKNHLLRGFM